jgi:hypothetical protein
MLIAAYYMVAGGQSTVKQAAKCSSKLERIFKSSPLHINISFYFRSVEPCFVYT